VERAGVVLAVTLALAACAPPRERAPGAAPPAAAGAADAQRPLSEPGPPSVARASPATPAASGDAAPIVVPADVLYLCVSESGGARREAPIELLPNVAELCRKHPEMGPCRYERDVCRRSGGRVYAAGGQEITAQTEAEYDKKVMRVRLKSN
jgi:hypothetical protein